MKRHLISILAALLVTLILPFGLVAHAAGPPSPECVPEGNYCVNTFSGSVNVTGGTISATWSVDVYTGVIVTVSSSFTASSGWVGCGPTYTPSNPNDSPVAPPVRINYLAQDPFYKFNDWMTLTGGSGYSSGSSQALSGACY